MEVLTLPHLEDLDMADATRARLFVRPDLTSFCRLDALGLVVNRPTPRARSGSARVPGPRTRPVVPSLRVRRRPARHRPAASGPRAARVAAHGPRGQHPPLPVHRVCTRVAPRQPQRWPNHGRSCHDVGFAGRWSRSWSVTSSPPASPPASGSRGTPPTTAVLAEGKRVLIDDEHRFDGVRVIGVDEHVWRHTRRGDKFVCEPRIGWSGTGHEDGAGLLRWKVTRSTCGPSSSRVPSL